MKYGTRNGLGLKYKREEKEPVLPEEEKFWKLELLGKKTAKSLLSTIFFYNGKLFGLRGGEHRNLTIANFEVGLRKTFPKLFMEVCST